MLFRLALRRLIKAPVFTAFSIVTLAAGIGVTTAIYSALLGMRHQTVGVTNPNDVVTLRQAVEYVSDFSEPEFAELRAGQTAFSGLAAAIEFRTGLSAEGRAELVRGEAVSGDYFLALGVRPLLGRLLQPDDDRPDAVPAVVLAETTWRRLFNRDLGIVGRTVRLSGRPFDVVGVAPRGFNGVLGKGWVAPAVWAPVAVTSWSRRDLSSRDARDLTVIGRLAPGMTPELAASRLQPLLHQMEIVAPLDRSPQHRPRQPMVVSTFDDLGSHVRVEGSMLVAWALPALVLFVACTNLANLVLSRNASRRHEFAVRRALGASRWRVIREQLAEGAIVSAAGGVAGCLVAARLLAFVVQIAQDLGGAQASAVFTPVMDSGVFAAAGGFALVAFLIASLSPAVQLTRTSDRTMLASDTGAGVAPPWRGRANLITLQVWVSVCLFLLTALGVRVILNEGRSASSATAAEDRVTQVDLPFSEQGRDEATARRIADRIVMDLRGQAGIESVALTARSIGFNLALTRPDRPFVANVNQGDSGRLTLMTPEALGLMGTSIRFGRRFNEHDDAGQTPVVIVSESLAQALFGRADVAGEMVLGRSVVLDPLRYVTKTYQIVGVSANTLNSNGRVVDIAYAPFTQHYIGEVSILARGRRMDIDETATMIRTAVRHADPDVAVSFAGRADPERWGQATIMRLLTAAGASLAGLTLLISMTGLYGVLSHVVARRTRELGLRMALGADRGRIVRLVLGSGFRPVIEGLVLGLISAIIIRLMLQPLFTDPLAGLDLIVVAIAAGPLLIAAGLACYLPARRAARVEPNVALREA